MACRVPSPLQGTIADALRILGFYPAGSTDIASAPTRRLPTDAELSARFGLSRQTALSIDTELEVVIASMTATCSV